MSSVLFCKYCLVPHCGKIDNCDDNGSNGGDDDDNESKEEQEYTLTIGIGLSEGKKQKAV